MTHDQAVLNCGSPLAELIADHDWSSSPLGAQDKWPQSLRSLVELMLSSDFPMFLSWGPKSTVLYNDAYAPILSRKHPWALGQPLHLVWSEIWEQIEPMVERALAGTGSYHEDLSLNLVRNEFEEQAWFTFSYSPVRDDEGNIAGVFCVCNETTQKVLAQQHLAAESERLRELFQEAPGFMVVFREPEHVFEMVNKAALDVVGQRELVGKPIRGALPELEMQGIIDILDNVYRSGEPFFGYRMPMELQREPNGSPEQRFLTFVLQPLRNPDGTVNGIFAQGHDVTDAQRAQEALARSEAHLLRAQQVAALGSWELDFQTDQLTWSEQTYRLYGVDPATFTPTYDKVMALFHEEDRPKDLTQLEQLRTEHGLVEFTARFLRGDGEVRWGTFAATLVLDEEERPKSLTGTVQDVTEQIQTEQALRASETQARAVIEASPDAFVRLDENGEVTEWSGQAEALFSWTRAEAVGRSLADLIIPDELRAAHQAGIARHRNSPSTRKLNIRTQVPARNRQGEVFPVELTVVSTLWDGRITFNGFFRDIREKLAAEGRLRQAQKIQAVGQLTGGIAHDFNNLLAITIGNLEMLEESSDLSSDSKELLSEALDAAFRGADLTARLLSFSRQQTLQPRSTDVNALIAEYAKLLGRLLGADIDLRLDLASRLWEATVDRVQLEAAITNLATNARDAMPNGGCLTISTRNETLDGTNESQHLDVASGDYVAVEVTDTGHGMSAQVIEHAIEPFFTTKEEGKGTGLGLSMVFGFAKQSGGHVRIYSEVGSGTTVTLLLPRAVIAVEDDALVDPQLPQAKASETVLIVEDDSSLRRMATIQLRSLGYDVLEAEDGQAALQLLTRHPEIDLLLTDIVMPAGLSGVALGRRAQSLRPGLKLMYMSGFPQSAFGNRAHLEPGVVFMRKPFRKADLAVNVRKALESHG